MYNYYNLRLNNLLIIIDLIYKTPKNNVGVWVFIALYCLVLAWDIYCQHRHLFPPKSYSSKDSGDKSVN